MFISVAISRKHHQTVPFDAEDPLLFHAISSLQRGRGEKKVLEMRKKGMALEPLRARKQAKGAPPRTGFTFLDQDAGDDRFVFLTPLSVARGPKFEDRPVFGWRLSTILGLQEALRGERMVDGELPYAGFRGMDLIDVYRAAPPPSLPEIPYRMTVPDLDPVRNLARLWAYQIGERSEYKRAQQALEELRRSYENCNWVKDETRPERFTRELERTHDYYGMPTYQFAIRQYIESLGPPLLEPRGKTRNGLPYVSTAALGFPPEVVCNFPIPLQAASWYRDPYGTWTELD